MGLFTEETFIIKFWSHLLADDADLDRDLEEADLDLDELLRLK